MTDIREAVAAFLRLNVTSRYMIAQDLGVAEGIENHPYADRVNEILRRIRQQGKIDQFMEIMK